MDYTKIVPEKALDYIRNKKLKPAFSYKDVWNEEHATAFTVAKAMQVDVLSDIKTSLEQAMADGQTFDWFKKNLKPTLMQKGWWGKKDMVDPETGETIKAQLGSDRRLKTIYNINLRSAYQKGSYDRTMASDAHPYLVYHIGPSVQHRAEHVKWNGLILPKTDPWWNAHLPPNGWGCQCWTSAATEDRKQRYERDGVPSLPEETGAAASTVPAQTTAPPTIYRNYYNPRRGIVEKIPDGIEPGFNWNQGAAGRELPIFESFMKKGNSGSFGPQIESVAKSILTSQIKKDEFMSFIENAYDGKINADYATPVGFVDKEVSLWLRKNAGINTGDSVTIALEARLMNSVKAARHAATGTAVDKAGAGNLIESILYGQVYFERNTGNLIYLGFDTDTTLCKIVVNPGKQLKTSNGKLNTPTVISLQTITTSEPNNEEYKRITEKLERIK